ncbi:MAG: hypothetical protein NT062_26680, partial [Proteobacteria bacterium]|nr:hypothetical protein [Pseudomonadota bacterium]
AFLDGDCAPTPTWLAALTRPFATGARVVAGATTYAGELAAVANRLDFPYFDRARLRSFGAGDPGAYEVRNFFANNVAFRRDVFAAHPYPTITPMFHGQCQVLALTLAAHGIAIRYAAAARVTHAWPGSLAAWLEVRLLRGADAVSLLPYVMPITRHLGALPALAMFGARALLALRRGPRLRALGLIASVTVVDAIGAATAGRVYRALA